VGVICGCFTDWLSAAIAYGTLGDRTRVVKINLTFPELGRPVCGLILPRFLCAAMDGSSCIPLSLVESLLEAYPIDTPFFSDSRLHCILLAYQLSEDVRRMIAGGIRGARMCHSISVKSVGSDFRVLNNYVNILHRGYPIVKSALFFSPLDLLYK